MQNSLNVFITTLINMQTKYYINVINMSTKHLAAGSVEPPRTEGILTIYSMKYCPYAQRPLLVLKAKNIPHEIVNINLTRKPDWYFKIHPEGKVPALIDGSKTIIESLDICDYLDEKYPEPPLYPADPAAKEKDKRVIEKSSKLINLFFKCLYSLDATTPQEWAKLLLIELQEVENELASRGSTFFGGEKPGMIDYMIWPWAERSEIVNIKYGENVLKDTDIPLLRKWKATMLKQPVCRELYINGEQLWNYFEPKLSNQEPKYDDVQAKM